MDHKVSVIKSVQFFRSFNLNATYIYFNPIQTGGTFEPSPPHLKVKYVKTV